MEVPLQAPAEDRASRAMGFSLVLHAALLVGGALTVPSLEAIDAMGAEPSRDYLLAQVFAETAEREPEERPATQIAELDPDGEERVDSRCASELHGSNMGEPTGALTGDRYGVQGPGDNPDPHVARALSTSDEPFEWVLGPLKDGAFGGDAKAPTAFYGREDSLGNDAESALGNMWGPDIGVARGVRGVGVGLPELCEHCGHTGHGAAALELMTTPGGATGTERNRAAPLR